MGCSYAPNSELNRSQKEELATNTYVNLTQFYNNLPSFLKIPHSIKIPLAPHIYSLQ
jgi:hypothetical protein